MSETEVLDPEIAPTGALELPHRRQEGWRWSAFAGQSFEAQSADAVPAPLGLDGAVRVSPEPGRPCAGVEIAESALDDVWAEGPFAQRIHVHTARQAAPAAGLIAISGAPSAPLVLDHHHWRAYLAEAGAPEGAGDGAPVRVRIRVEAGALAVLVEHLNMADALTEALTEIEIAPGATLAHLVVHDGDDAQGVAHTRAVHVGEDAAYVGASLTMGARRARLETQVRQLGNGAVTLLGAALTAGARHADHTTHVRHEGLHGVTREVFRSVAADTSTGVFQGKIHVERAAQKTDATMDHAGLVLGERAVVNAKPELEIYADDVQCAHGNAIGAMDPMALFYLRQRGLNLAQARAVLVRAFVAGAFSGVELPEALRELVLARANAWMEAHL